MRLSNPGRKKGRRSGPRPPVHWLRPIASIRRNPKQAEEERRIFEIFAELNPACTPSGATADQPDGPFPDVVVETRDKQRIGYELGEWLQTTQMAAAMRLSRQEKALARALAPQGPNRMRHADFVSLEIEGRAPPFDARDATAFNTELKALVAAEDARIAASASLQARAYHACNDLRRYPTVRKYLKQVLFGHSRPGKRRPGPFAVGGWITFKPLGGSYSPQTAIDALKSIISQKTGHYGSKGSGRVSLIVYYSKAWAYNTPYLGVDVRTFADVARIAAGNPSGATPPFERIYLVSALLPGPEAFEIYPRVRGLPGRRFKDAASGTQR